MNNNKDSEIFFVSDLEGCYVKIRKSEQQSRLQCSDIFFDALRKHLKIKPKNKVAFLGDYFEGPEFLTSITKIVNLHQDFPEKVYIILGNRDVNKLRLLFELDELTCPLSNNNNINSEFSSNTSKINYWGTWLEFYPEYLKALKDKNKNKNKNNEKRFTLFKIILDKSMGTVPNYQTVDSHYKIMYKKYNKHILVQSTNKNEEKKNLINLDTSIKGMKNGIIKNHMLNLLNEYNKNIFNQSNNSMKLNPIMYLFENGSLVSYDKDYKVLMSHGGGIDAVPTKNYYSSIVSELEKSSLSNNALDYFKNIEIARKELMKIPRYNNHKNKPTNIETLIKVGNLPLRNFMVKPSINNPYYYILQASGLKPDSGKPFVSFIHSCDLNEGFAGPKKYNQSGINIKDTNLIYLKNLGVDFISFGHINFSLPNPLIYSRLLKNNNSSKNRMVFIANDISNFRPFGYNIPISYIKKPHSNKINISQYKTGVKGIVNVNNILNNENKKKYGFNKENVKSEYGFMKQEFNYNEVPLVDTTNGTPSISYINTKKLKFKKNFLPPEIRIEKRKRTNT
jgi:hypothetical protein